MGDIADALAHGHPTPPGCEVSSPPDVAPPDG
jgi:hypothetical protein